MFGLIPKKVELALDAEVETVTEALQAPHAGLRVSLDGQRLKLVYGPNPKEPVTVIEGALIDHGSGCVIDGWIRWGRVHQLFLVIGLTFLSAFCFGIPAIMMHSYFVGTMSSSVVHPLVIAISWMVLTWLPFHLLLRVILKSRLPKIEDYLRKIIGEQAEAPDRRQRRCLNTSFHGRRSGAR